MRSRKSHLKTASLLFVLAIHCSCVSSEAQGPEPLLEPERAEAAFVYPSREDDIADRTCRVVLRTVERIDPACVEETCWLAWLATFDVDEHQLAAGARPGLLYESSMQPDIWWMTGAREVPGAGEGFVRYRAVVWKHTLEAARQPEHGDELVIELVPILTQPSDTRIIDLNRDRARSRHNPLNADNDWSLSEHPHLCTGQDLWTLEPVGSAQVQSDDAPLSLGQDSQGRSHVIYPGTTGLMYTRRDAEGWSDPVVVAEPSAADGAYAGLDLALDDQDRLHVASCWADYRQDPPVSGLTYHRLEGPAWLEEQLDTTCRGWDVSLALDAQGAPHLAWADRQEGLYHASMTDAGWVIGQIAAREASSPTLGFDARGELHLVYYRVVDFGDQSVIVLDRKEDGTWEPRSELQDVYVMRDRSAVFDSHGQPHLGLFAYMLGYATLTEQTWVLEDVDTSFHGGLAVSIGVHESGSGVVIPMMSYWDAPSDGIALAWKPADRWYHIVATYTDYDANYAIANRTTAISLDPDGRPHILYSLEREESLWYAAFDRPFF